jgi:acyl-homoserine lactone acylase PvdQ
MVKTRAIFSGRLAELFGPDAVPLDEFARTIGYRRVA